ncbi:MAG: integration host factor subunit beta [Methylotenera sp.]|uniref:integration host factor subunit beta n=1 Tax=Methylotenera sp. TaxID=2051956 RepID=UPI001814F52A|nr:integration host factor subunit beta [Methylotenera sp.]NOU24404.1 integration host factor subunit beta [Methylotenera sp.]
MVRSELIQIIASKFPQLTLSDVDASVMTIIDGMTDSLAKGDRVEVRGFGCFVINYRPPRIARNPKTGARVEVAAKYAPHFKVGKELKEMVDK